MADSSKWYDNRLIVHLLLFFFFPVGLYALWKSSTIAQWWKITATVLIGLSLLSTFSGGGNKNSTNSNGTTATVTNQPQLSQAQMDSIATVEKAQNRAKEIENRKNNTIGA